MVIRVKFFASLSETLGLSEQRLEHQTGVTVLEVWQQATQNLALPNNTLAALNMEYVGFQQVVQDGDEVAFFPPVTGG